MDSQDTSSVPPPPATANGVETASDGESFHSGDEDFDSSLGDGKGVALAPEKAGTDVADEGLSGGDAKDGVLGDGDVETLASEGGGAAESEKVGLEDGGGALSSVGEKSFGLDDASHVNSDDSGETKGAGEGTEKEVVVSGGGGEVGSSSKPSELGEESGEGDEGLGAGGGSGSDTVEGSGDGKVESLVVPDQNSLDSAVADGEDSAGGSLKVPELGAEGGEGDGVVVGTAEGGGNGSEGVDGDRTEKVDSDQIPLNLVVGTAEGGGNGSEGVDGDRTEKVDSDQIPLNSVADDGGESAGGGSKVSALGTESGEGDEGVGIEVGGVSGSEVVEGSDDGKVESKDDPLDYVDGGGGESVEEKTEPLGLDAKDEESSGIGGGVHEDSSPDVEEGSNANGSSGEMVNVNKAGDEVDAVQDLGTVDIVDGQDRGTSEAVVETRERELAEIVDVDNNGTVNLASDANQEEIPDSNVDGGDDGGDREILNSEEPAKVVTLGSSEAVKQLLKDLEGGSSAASPVVGSHDFSQEGDGQIATDSDEEADTDEEGGGGQEVFDSAALAALLRAAAGGSSDGNITISAPDGSRIFTVDRPAGLGSSIPSLRPGPARAARLAPPTSSDLTVTAEPESNMDEEERALHEKVDNIRVKFLRLVHRLGHTAEDTVAAQVLYRLGLAEGIKRGRQTSRAFSIENAKRKALRLEESGEEPLEFSCNILVLGKTGAGKSSIINSILGEPVAQINAFQPSTCSVREISGVVDGVKIRFLDTPGLRPSIMEQNFNKKILSSVKKYTKKCPPDIVLYVDRLDTQTRDFNDLPLLRSIASTLGSSIWFNAIVALTHAASAPPDGPNGTPLGYEVFVAQRSHVVQHSIRQAAGDMRLMNPVALVENHPSCRRNRQGERVLPNGTAWKPQLLLLCYSSKTLSEANSLLKLQDPSPGKLFGFRMRSPPLPYLLSSLLQSRAYPKLSSDLGGDNIDSDVDLGDLSDSDQEEEGEEYDQLPPFKPLKKIEIAILTEEERKAYFDEYDYRVKLLQKKQWKDELRRFKEMKKRRKMGRRANDRDMVDDYDQDNTPAAIPVPLPDMVLPPTFDCDNPGYRYRFLEPTSQLLARPVLDSHGWDHDCGYDGVSLEENLAIIGRFPASVAVQITKDKKEFNVHLDSSVAAKHGENGASLAGFDIQSVGRQLAYILRGETKFKNLKKNKTSAGISVTFLGENVVTGLKLEDQLVIGKRVSLVGSTGAVRSQGDVAYGANLEARLREKDYPIGQDVTTLGLSLMKWRRDLALGANLQSQFSTGRNTKVAVRFGLNNKLTGQFSVRTSTSDQLQIALLGVIPIAVSFYRTIWPGESY